MYAFAGQGSAWAVDAGPLTIRGLPLATFGCGTEPRLPASRRAHSEIWIELPPIVGSPVTFPSIADATLPNVCDTDNDVCATT